MGVTMLRRDAATGWSLGLWIVFGLAPVLVSMCPWAEWKSDSALAAWVQAVGAVVAVLVAGAAIILQHALTVRQKAADENVARRRRIEGARRIIKGGAYALRKTTGIFQSAGPLGPSQLYLDHATSELSVIVDVLGRVDALDFDDWPQTEAIATALSAARTAHRILSGYQHAGPGEVAINKAEAAESLQRLQAIMMDREAVLAGALGYPKPII